MKYKYPDGSEAWYLDGKYHREDGPAYTHTDGTEEWFVNGIRHRLDGPAVVHTNGVKLWYVHGERLEQAQFNIVAVTINNYKLLFPEQTQ
jgi:hypothetical protein